MKSWLYSNSSVAFVHVPGREASGPCRYFLVFGQIIANNILCFPLAANLPNCLEEYCCFFVLKVNLFWTFMGKELKSIKNKHPNSFFD
jgi:hypothetical protein